MHSIIFKSIIALCCLTDSLCFISPTTLHMVPRSYVKRVSLQTKNGNFTESFEPTQTKHNNSNIYKIKFSDSLYEEDDFFEPKYALGLSEFDIIIIRICFNITIIIYFYTINNIRIK